MTRTASSIKERREDDVLSGLLWAPSFPLRLAVSQNAQADGRDRP